MKTLAVAALCALPLVAASAADRIWDDRPGADWESTWYPLGNGRLGCMVDGGARKLREMIARGCHSRFTVRRKDAVLLELPVIVLILGLLFAFKASALLLVIGLFAGCRYSVGEQECAESEVKTAAEA